MAGPLNPGMIALAALPKGQSGFPALERQESLGIHIVQVLTT